MTKYIVKSVKGPYDGPFSKGITTFFLKEVDNIDSLVLMWHSGPNKELIANEGDIISGIVLKEGKVDYNNSNPIIQNV